MSATRPGATLDRFVPILDGIRSDMNAGARAGAPGCILVIVTAIAGAIALAYSFQRDAGWQTDPTVLVSVVGYVAAVWLVWKAGARWATPAAAVAERASRRLETDVLQPLVADMRRDARYVAKATAPPGTLGRSRLVHDRVFTSANQIRWHAGDLDLEMFEVESVETSSDSPSRDRYFIGLLAWAEMPELDDDLYVVVRSRHEFPDSVPARGESVALDGFAMNSAYRVVSNFEDFARAVCTPRVQDYLLRLAAEGTWVHAAVADRRVWVGIEVEKDMWFRRYPAWTFPLLGALDNAHVAALERPITIVETLATEFSQVLRTITSSRER